MNAFSIVGKITDMPILKETSNGLKTCELPIRVQRNFPNSEGVYKVMMWSLKYGEVLQKL